MPVRYSTLLMTSGLLIAAGLLLNACQPRPAATGIADLTPADPEPQAATSQASSPGASSPGASSLAVPDAFAGRWFVSAVYPIGAARASIGDQHLGVSLVVGADEVSDVNGQRCLAPSIAIDQGRQDLAIGALTLSDAEMLSITCKGKPFATYLLMPGSRLDASYQDATELPHALIADRPEARYLLERAEHVLLRQASLPAALAGEGKMAPAVATLAPSSPVTIPAAPAKPVVPEQSPAPALAAPLVLAPAMPEPANPAPIPAVVDPAATVAATAGASLPAPGTAIHLASYSGISAAKRGWKILLGDFDVLDPLSPLYVSVDVPQKGPMVRLYATGGDAVKLGQACTALRTKGAYCELSR